MRICVNYSTVYNDMLVAKGFKQLVGIDLITILVKSQRSDHKRTQLAATPRTNNTQTAYLCMKVQQRYGTILFIAHLYDLLLAQHTWSVKSSSIHFYRCLLNPQIIAEDKLVAQSFSHACPTVTNVLNDHWKMALWHSVLQKTIENIPFLYSKLLFAILRHILCLQLCMLN